MKYDSYNVYFTTAITYTSYNGMVLIHLKIRSDFTTVNFFSSKNVFNIYLCYWMYLYFIAFHDRKIWHSLDITMHQLINWWLFLSFLTIVNDTAINIHFEVSVWICFIFLESIAKILELSNQIITVFNHFKNCWTLDCFPKWLHHLFSHQ